MATEVKRTTKIIDRTCDYVVIQTGCMDGTISHFLNHGYTFTLEYYEYRDDQHGGRVKGEKRQVTLSRQLLKGYEAVSADGPHLLELLPELNEKYSHEPTYDRKGETDVRRAYPPLFIDDTGRGRYNRGLYVRADVDMKEITLIRKCVEEYQTSAIHGSIAFHCRDLLEAFEIAEKLSELRYCGCFHPRYPTSATLLEDEESRKRVLYLKYDCGSG